MIFFVLEYFWGVKFSYWIYSLNSLIGQSFVTRQQVDNTAIGFRITLHDIPVCRQHGYNGPFVYDGEHLEWVW